MSARWDWQEIAGSFYFQHPLGIVDIQINPESLFPVMVRVNQCPVMNFRTVDFAKLAAENLFAFDRAKL